MTLIFTMRLLITLLTVAIPSSTWGFVATPTTTSGVVSSSQKSSAFEDEIGAQPPLGFFDPLGLVADGDEEKFNRLRYVELKHGRIAMLAVLGHLVTTGNVRLPGDIDLAGTSFASIPSGFAALSKIPSAGLAQIFVFIGFLEIAVMKDVTGRGEFVGKTTLSIGGIVIGIRASYA